ncbi:hypothetical protein ACP4OV_007087 [Aristida adscensionis]
MASLQDVRPPGDAGDEVHDGWRPRPRRRVLVFPLPFQGHINPMLQLAGVLHARGLAASPCSTPGSTRRTPRCTRSSSSSPCPTASPPTPP